MYLEELFMILIIYDLKRIYTAIFDVPGAYLHAEMHKYNIVLLRLWGDFVDILYKVKPDKKKKSYIEWKKDSVLARG